MDVSNQQDTIFILREHRFAKIYSNARKCVFYTSTLAKRCQASIPFSGLHMYESSFKSL